MSSASWPQTLQQGLKQNFGCMRKQVVSEPAPLFPRRAAGSRGGPTLSFCEPSLLKFHAGAWATMSLCPVAQGLSLSRPLPSMGWAMTVTMAWNRGGEVQ